MATAVSAVAAGSGDVASRVPKPHPEIANPGKCVAPTEYMRKHHMDVLYHERYETVHKGIRNKRDSLTNCIQCHASRKNDSVLGSNQNFCQSCHKYAGVKIDCFECHSSKPKGTADAAFHPIIPSGAKADADGAAQGLELSMQEHMRTGVVTKNTGGESR